MESSSADSICLSLKKELHIAVSVLLQDAGEATRSLEIMKIIRDSAPDDINLHITFFSHGSKFEQRVLDSGFQILKVDPPMKGEGYLEDFMPSAIQFIGDKDLAYQVVKGEVDALRKCRPDLLIHGFSPFTGIARKLITPPVPAISFLPLPFDADMFGSQLLHEFPDQVPLLPYLPKSLQHILMSKIPAAVKLKAPVLKQQYLIDAASACGWPQDMPLQNLFDMLRADLTIVNDLPLFYQNIIMPDYFRLTGPLFSPSAATDRMPAGIADIFHKQNPEQINLFCTMGSSARKDFLIEAAKAIASLPEKQYHAVILVPAAICPISEIQSLISGHSNIFLTADFVPARLVSEEADLTICHGGQGTVQTAIDSGCPVLGFAMQPEQQINLDHIAAFGAGYRLPSGRWKKNCLCRIITKMCRQPHWKQNAIQLQYQMHHINTKERTSAEIWNFINHTL